MKATTLSRHPRPPFFLGASGVRWWRHLGKELGWRGFALPLLETRFGAIRASLILGSIWGIWHLPFILLPSSS